MLRVAMPDAAAVPRRLECHSLQVTGDSPRLCGPEGGQLGETAGRPRPLPAHARSVARPSTGPSPPPPDRQPWACNDGSADCRVGLHPPGSTDQGNSGRSKDFRRRKWIRRHIEPLCALLLSCARHPLTLKQQVRAAVLTQSKNSDTLERQPLASDAGAPEKGSTMAKGHKCPSCDKNTLQPYTTNQLRCSNCGTIVKKT